MTRKLRTYTGDFHHAETGEDSRFIGITIAQLLARVRTMRDGDVITINCEEREGELS